MALTDNILAYWNLNDNGSGGVSLVDSTGNGNTFTNNYGVALGAGIIDGGGQFNNANWLQTSALPAFGTSNFSISAWVNPNVSQAGYPVIFNTRVVDSPDISGFTFGVNGDQLFVYADTFLIASAGSIPANVWSYVTLVRSGDDLSVYVNGSSVASGSVAGYDFTQSGASVAGFQTASTWYWNGNIDEVGVWNRALTSTEITQLYNSGTGLTYPFAGFYFSGGNLSTLGNWWANPAFTIPAASLPTSEDAVVISSAVTSGTATYASATITANIGSAVTITAMITLTNAVNSGTLVGTTALNGTASNAGTITGNAIVYYAAQNPLGGSVSGTITYIWPSGTGLWGGEVWIDGSLSFIIPDPSDVRSGVEYGPAEDPYVGTFSGGGGGIDLARLIGLPPFIQL